MREDTKIEIIKIGIANKVPSMKEIIAARFSFSNSEIMPKE